MALGRIDGLIRRRVLVNYRAEPAAIARRLPEPFRVQQVQGYAMLGVCLIRIEHVRPSGVRVPVTLASENAAYRVAVEWTADGLARSGVYIARRDTSSGLQHALGSVLFPGQYEHSAFEVVEQGEGPGSRIEIRVRSGHGEADVELVAEERRDFPGTPCFDSLEAASAFFAAGSVGYSPRRGSGRLDGLQLDADRWHVRPLRVLRSEASFLARWSGLDTSALELDNALLMRDTAHTWQALQPLEPSTVARSIA